MLMGSLNQIRRDHASLQQLRRLTFHHAPHDKAIAYSKSDQGDTVLVICSLDPNNTVESDVYLDMGALGLPGRETVHLRDELTGATFTWGTRNFVRLPPASPAHILHVLDRG